MVAVLGFSFPGGAGAVAAASHKSVAQGSTELAVDLYRELGQRTGKPFLLAAQAFPLRLQ